jgi:hypothetical protein
MPGGAVLTSFLRGASFLSACGYSNCCAFAALKEHPRVVTMLCIVTGHLLRRLSDRFRNTRRRCAFPSLQVSSLQATVGGVCLFFCLEAFLVGRALQVAASLPAIFSAIYLQQWQTANFLSTCYSGAAIAANDIGAINFRSDLHTRDLVGLASSEVFSAKRAGSYSTQFIDHEISRRGIEIAVIYDSWFLTHPKTRLGGPTVLRRGYA